MLPIAHPAGYSVHDHSNGALCQCRLLVLSGRIAGVYVSAFATALGTIRSVPRKAQLLVRSPVMAAAGRVLRLSDVATAAGVSLATASRALNGQAGVGAELAEKVRNVAQELGYVANVH
ncbi:MAG TPA: helix-turn-helix domain-containing protein, partial [Propionibacteriaceae bacterium]|nr:helix-turn-helix domain-containing protein [Propionibacteriaceae bacterium]